MSSVGDCHFILSLKFDPSNSDHEAVRVAIRVGVTATLLLTAPIVPLDTLLGRFWTTMLFATPATNMSPTLKMDWIHGSILAEQPTVVKCREHCQPHH